MGAPVEVESLKGATHRRRGRRRGKRYFGQVRFRGGIWYVRIRRNGVEFNEPVGPDRTLAEARLAAIHEATAKENALGVKTIARVTWAEFTTRLLGWLRANHEATTYAGEVGRVRAVGEWLGAKVLDDVTRADADGFLTSLRNDRKATAGTSNRYRALLRVAFRLAVESGFARANPADGLRWAREQARPVPYLDPGALDRILGRAEKSFGPFLTLAADTGLRRGELHRLAWEDVDLAGAALTVRRSKNHDARRVPLTPRAVEVLRALDAERGPAPIQGSVRVFPTLNDASGPSAVSKAWKAAAVLAGFPSLRLHDARHAYASALARAGVAPGVIGTLLGDRTPAVVFRYSRHAPKDAAAEAVALLAEARGQDTKAARAEDAEGGDEAQARGA